MSAGVKRLAIFAAILTVFVVLGGAFLGDTGGGELADPPPAAGLAPEAAPVSAPDNPTTTTSTTTSSTTTTLPPTRTIQVTVFPADADVTTTVSGAGGTVAEGGTEVSASVAGRVYVTVVGEAHRPEQIEIDTNDDTGVTVWLDPPDQVVDRRLVFSTGAAPKQVAFTPDSSELWVTLLGGTGLEAYDPSSGELIAAIQLPGGGSVEAIFDRAGERAFVSQMETASVYEVDVASHTVTRRLDTEGTWTKGMLLSPDEETLWASNWVSNDVSELDLASGELVRRLPTVTTPRGLAIDSTGKQLYVAGYDDGQIQVIDLKTGEGRVIHHTGGAMRHLVADPSGTLIYASDMARDQILVVDTTTEAVTVMSSTERLPNTIDLSPDGKVLAVSNRGRNNPASYYLAGPQWGSVLLIDTATGELLDAIVGGNQPTGLDISRDGAWLAYSDFLDDRVSVYALPAASELVGSGGGRSQTYGRELDK